MDITERLRALYVEHGDNYVQEAAFEIERLRRVISDVTSSLATRNAPCDWEPQESSCDELWTSGCGVGFHVGDADEPRNWMVFCPFCGGPSIFPEATK